VPEYSQVFPDTVNSVRHHDAHPITRMEKNAGRGVPELPQRNKKATELRAGHVTQIKHEDIEIQELNDMQGYQYPSPSHHLAQVTEMVNDDLIDQPHRPYEPKYKSRRPAPLDLSLPGARPGAANDPLRHRLPNVERRDMRGKIGVRERPSQIPLPVRRVRGLRMGRVKGRGLVRMIRGRGRRRGRGSISNFVCEFREGKMGWVTGVVSCAEDDSCVSYVVSCGSF
jgi:hypothetical protein